MLLYLVRHGDRATTTYNSIPRQDKGLTPKGKIQAELLAERLKNEKIQALYSSAFPRALQTASAISKMTGLKQTVVEAFGEVNVGAWNGFSKEELRARMPEEYDEWHSHPEKYRFPGGEGLAEVKKRVMPALEEILNSHKHENICIVTHEAVIEIIVISLLPGKSLSDFHKLKVDKASLTVLDVNSSEKFRANLLLHNDTSHLKGLE